MYCRETKVQVQTDKADGGARTSDEIKVLIICIALPFYTIESPP